MSELPGGQNEWLEYPVLVIELQDLYKGTIQAIHQQQAVRKELTVYDADRDENTYLIGNILQPISPESDDDELIRSKLAYADGHIEEIYTDDGFTLPVDDPIAYEEAKVIETEINDVYVVYVALEKAIAYRKAEVISYTRRQHPEGPMLTLIAVDDNVAKQVFYRHNRDDSPLYVPSNADIGQFVQELRYYGQ